MDYNKTTISIGKIRTFDSISGEIVSKDGEVYMFTKDGISEGEEVTLNDIVLFRGEEIHDTKVAYFIKRLEPDKELNNQVYLKTKNIKYNKGNE